MKNELARRVRNMFVIRAVLLLVAAFSIGGIAIRLYAPSGARPSDSPVEEFSAMRAFAHVTEIAREPHHFAKGYKAQVRRYIQSEIEELGWRAEVQTGPVETNPVENLLVRIPGSDNTRAVLIAVHYDSALISPGAGDNGAAVAAALETLRALRYRQPLKNDLIVAFIDGEESGLRGSKAFIADAAIAKSVGLVCNFDARGTRGPSIMFETSPQNGALISKLSRHFPRAIATSISSFVYKHMPNVTDFTVFTSAGIAGMNFAFIGGAEHYHRSTDRPENLSKDTLQHTGEIMMQAIETFGNCSLPLPVVQDFVYFNVVGSWLVAYPESWVASLIFATCSIGLLTVYILRRKKSLTFGALAFSTGAAFSAALSSGIFGAGIFFGIKKLGLAWPPPTCGLLLGGMCSIAVTIYICFKFHQLREVRYEGACSTMLLWTTFACFIGPNVPSASYIFIWPAIVGWLGLLLSSIVSELPRGKKMARLLYILGPCFGIAFLTPLFSLIWSALPLSLPLICLIGSLFLWGLIAWPTNPIAESQPKGSAAASTI